MDGFQDLEAAACIFSACGTVTSLAAVSVLAVTGVVLAEAVDKALLAAFKEGKNCMSCLLGHEIGGI